jgi:hypothetical protein
MPSSGKLCRVAVVRTDVSEERIVSIIRMTRIGGLRTTLARCEEMFRSVLRLLVTDNVIPSYPILVTLKKGVMHSSETAVHIRNKRRYIPEEGYIHKYRCDNLGSYNRICFTDAFIDHGDSVGW